MQSVKRIDIVWDVYLDDSLKLTTREKRGQGQRRKVLLSTRIPGDWRGFLKVSDNKTELFQLLAENVITLDIPEGKEIYTTIGKHVLSTTNRSDIASLDPCTHEEADTRLFIHALDASSRGHRRVMLKSNDTDVVVLAVSVANIIPAEELWVTFGLGKHLQIIATHSIAASMGQERASCLPLFHALTGCDTVSFFGGRGKITAWSTWNVYPELTTALLELKATPEIIDEEQMKILERFTVLLYDRTSRFETVNEARQDLFSRKSRPIENIPPTREALVQHTKRAVLQGSYIWSQTLLTQPVIPCPSRWGWKRDGDNWTPYWTTLNRLQDACQQLIRCGCKIACKGRCKCKKAELPCTGLCKCSGECE